MRCVIPKLVDSVPARERTFRAVRTLKAALRIAAKLGAENVVKCRKVQYGQDVRDVRYVVNFFGSNPRERVKIGRTRRIMWHGITFDRQLPVVRS